MKKVMVAFVGLLIFITTIAWATGSPLELLENTSNQLIEALQKNQATLKTKPTIVYQLVNNILLPHVDLEHMSIQALGATAWGQATAMQKQEFIYQFTTLLIRTYASALAQYTNEKVMFLPIRSDFSGATRVEIKSNIIRDTGPSIQVSYRLRLLNGQWKLYDFSVDGVSMIVNFRDQFAQELQQTGINGLINELKQYNTQNS